MNKKELLSNRVNFLYYEENMTQEDIGKLLKISRQTVNSILNANKDHKFRKVNRKSHEVISRKVQFNANTSPTISIPKDILERIGINNQNRNAEITVNGNSIIIKSEK